MPLETLDVDAIETHHSAQPPLLSALPPATRVPTDAGVFGLQRIELTAGRSAGVTMLLVDTGRVQAALLPTRGLGLWQARIDGLDLRWDSPARGPIHPRFVPLSEPSGIGWLDGFDELLVRCGLQSFGAPDFGPQGQLTHGLHGKIANLPTETLVVEVDRESGELRVTAEILEARFLVYQLRLTASYTFRIGEPTIDINDTVTNPGGTDTSMQLLYHINVGAPMLHAGATMHISGRRVVARDARAVEDLSQWASYLGPTPGYSEQVYFSAAQPVADGWAKSLLAAADSSYGVAVHYRPETLPYFSQWKNTVGTNDGYVTGFEPATGFPNPRSFEEAQGRVVPMAAGQSRHFQLKIEGIASSERLAELVTEINNADGGGDIAAVEFDPQWCLPR